MGGEKKWECRGRLRMRRITISLWKSLCLVRPSEVAWNFLKNDSMPALYSERQIPLSERCNWVSWEVKMLSYHFVFVLSPYVKLASIISFVWSLTTPLQKKIWCKSGAKSAFSPPKKQKKPSVAGTLGESLNAISSHISLLDIHIKYRIQKYV